MGRYAEDAKELLSLVGGKGNIAAVSHCMTRMRFALNDRSDESSEGELYPIRAVPSNHREYGVGFL